MPRSRSRGSAACTPAKPPMRAGMQLVEHHLVPGPAAPARVLPGDRRGDRPPREASCTSPACSARGRVGHRQVGRTRKRYCAPAPTGATTSCQPSPCAFMPAARAAPPPASPAPHPAPRAECGAVPPAASSVAPQRVGCAKPVMASRAASSTAPRGATGTASSSTGRSAASGCAAVQHQPPVQHRLRQGEGMAGAVGVQQQQRDVDARHPLRPRRRGAAPGCAPRDRSRPRGSSAFHAVEPGDVVQAGPKFRRAVQEGGRAQRRQALRRAR